MTVEMPDHQSDLVVKDNQGRIRFCIQGWGRMRVCFLFFIMLSNLPFTII